LKQRGFVTGQFSKEIQERLNNHLLTLFDPEVKPLDLINKVYTEEFQRLSQAIQNFDMKIITEYSKLVKNGGSSQLAQYLQNTFQLQENYLNIMFTKGLKRSQCALPIQLINNQNVR